MTLSADIPYNALVGKEIRLVGTHRVHHEYAVAASLIREQRIDVRPVITKTLPMEKIAEAVGRGEYLISNHAYLRSRDRLIPTAHVEHILLHGFHEQKKDSFRLEFGSWNYAIAGRVQINLMPESW